MCTLFNLNLPVTITRLVKRDQHAPLQNVRCLHHAQKDTSQLLLNTVPKECPYRKNYSQQCFGNHYVWDLILLFEHVLDSKTPTDFT